MKRYIRATSDAVVDLSMFTGTPIVPDTGFDKYNDFLTKSGLEYKKSAKHRTGKIVMMSPADYYMECSLSGFSSMIPIKKLKEQRRDNIDTLEYLNNCLNQGQKFDLPYIDYAENSQEGLHRMMVLGDRYGWDTEFPVLVVTKY